MTEITKDDIAAAVKVIAQTAVDNELYFSELDAVAGDGDFGASLAAGFKTILQDFDELDRSSIGAFLTKVSVIITSKVGGCSGPIWGTAFMKIGLRTKGKQSITGLELVEVLDEAIEGIKQRGGAKEGDKTLLDALIPVNRKLKELVIQSATKAQMREEVAIEAELAIERTKQWKAKRGRQSFTGERSCGSPDPGIVAIATMLKNIETTFS